MIEIVILTCNENEVNYDSSLSFEFLCWIDRSRSLVSTRFVRKKRFFSFRPAEDDFDLFHDLLEVECFMLN